MNLYTEGRMSKIQFCKISNPFRHCQYNNSILKTPRTRLNTLFLSTSELNLNKNKLSPIHLIITLFTVFHTLSVTALTQLLVLTFLFVKILPTRQFRICLFPSITIDLSSETTSPSSSKIDSGFTTLLFPLYP